MVLEQSDSLPQLPESSDSPPEAPARSEESSHRPRRQKLSKQERYLHMKEQRRLKRKEQKQRRKALRQAPDFTPAPPRPPTRRMSESSCVQRVVIDCSFDGMMSLKDVCKLHHQLNQCYGLNRRSPQPLQFHVTGVAGQLARRFEETDNRLGEKWDIHVAETGLTETFTSDELVYLSSESEEVLERLDDSKVYVIGGLVDHNHHKGHCHRVATEAGLATARLPIERHVRLNSRCVLTVNHVFQVMLLMTQTQDWTTSLREVIPRRKWLNSDMTADRDKADGQAEGEIGVEEEGEKEEEEEEKLEAV